MSRVALIHRLPILNFDIELRLPRDLTPDEAARIAKLVSTIAIKPDEPAAPPKPIEPVDGNP